MYSSLRSQAQYERRTAPSPSRTAQSLQTTLLPECLDDWIDENNPVRVIDAFVEALNLAQLGFTGVEPEATGRPAYHPSVLLKLYIYGYLNRVQSSRRLEREAGRNFEVMWLLGRLVPDHKTVADFRKDNGPAMRKVCARFVELCRKGLMEVLVVTVLVDAGILTIKVFFRPHPRRGILHDCRNTLTRIIIGTDRTREATLGYYLQGLKRVRTE